MENPDHKVDFAKPDIFCSAGDSASLLILESLFIQKYEPLHNVDSKSTSLYLFNCLFNSASLLLGSILWCYT